MNRSNDLTEGPIVRRLLVFFLPIAAGTLFQQLYNAVDAFVVGKFVGTGALAAVGGSPAILINLIIGFCVALSGGASVVISHHFGAQDYGEIRSAVKTSYLMSLVLGIIVGVLVILFSPTFLIWLKTPEDTYADALLYQRIYFAGSIFVLVFNMGSGILRAVGNSRFPFVCLIVSCCINIGLDILFVIGFHMGVAGVAWATVIAQAASSLLVTVKLCRTKECYGLRFFGCKASFETLRKMLAIGVPSGLQSSMYGISNMILQVGVNTLGTVVVASWAMSGKIDGAYWAISGAFGTAITTFVAQNYGAGRIDRVKECAKKGIWLFFFASIIISGIILCFANQLLHLFTDDAAVVSTTWSIFIYFVPYYLTWSFVESFTGILRGVGDTLYPSIILALGVCLFRVVWVFTVFLAYHNLTMLCICYPISWVITDIAIFIYYRKKSVIARAPA